MVNVLLAEAPGEVSPMLPPAGAVPLNVTLWVEPEICHVTVPPIGIVTLAGLKVRLGVLTVTPPGCEAATATVTLALRVMPFPVIVAVMLADPAETPVTTPEDETVALVGSLLVNTAWGYPDIAFPTWSRGVAVSWTVPPTVVCGEPGVSVTEVKVLPLDACTTMLPDIPECRVHS